MHVLKRSSFIIALLAVSLSLVLPALASAYSYYPSYNNWGYNNYNYQLVWCGYYYSYGSCGGGYGGHNNYSNHTFAPSTYVNTMPIVNVNASSYASASASSYSYPYSYSYYPYYGWGYNNWWY